MSLPITRKDNQNLIIGEVQSSKGYIRVQAWTNPVVADVDRLLLNKATSASVVTVASTFLAQPDHPRNITVTPGGTTNDVPAGDVTIVGTNIRGEVISEAVTFSANDSSAQVTLKAFKTVTSVTFPVQDGAGATYNVGVGDVLGLDRCQANGVDSVLYSDFAGAREATRPTVVAHATAVESNTVDINGTLDGAKDLVIVYVSAEKTGKKGTTV